MVFRKISNNKKRTIYIKGTDQLCKVVKLSVQCCGKILQDSFET